MELRGLLVRVVDEVSGTYVRCGHAGVSGRPETEAGEFAQSLLNLWSPMEKANLPCWNFDVDNGHLINIV